MSGRGRHLDSRFLLPEQPPGARGHRPAWTWSRATAVRAGLSDRPEAMLTDRHIINVTEDRALLLVALRVPTGAHLANVLTIDARVLGRALVADIRHCLSDGLLLRRASHARGCAR